MAAVIILGLAVGGPRWPLRSPWLDAAVLSAVVLVTPYVIWQAGHGWLQLRVAANIAGSAEGGRIGFLPFQLILGKPTPCSHLDRRAGPSCRRPAFPAVPGHPLAYAALAVIYLTGDGKAYYQASLYPALLGAGAVSAAAWTTRGSRAVRRTPPAAALTLSAAVNVLTGLRLLPLPALNGSSTVALNPDPAETVGRPNFVGTVAGVWRAIPSDQRANAIILTLN